jgi:hypothetical protein
MSSGTYIPYFTFILVGLKSFYYGLAKCAAYIPTVVSTRRISKTKPAMKAPASFDVSGIELALSKE